MSATLMGISSMATRLLLAELAAQFERRSGIAVALESVGGVDAARRVAAGEPFDFAVLASDAIDKLIAGGHVVTETRVDFARSGVAVAVRAGSPSPDLGSEAAVRQAVQSAASIGYSTGPSGAALVRLFERWGIASEVQQRTVQAPPGVPVGALVARGEVALGFQQLSELMNVEGIDVVGPLPDDIQVNTVFSAGLCACASRPELAPQLLEFLAAPETAQAKRRHGMQPA